MFFHIFLHTWWRCNHTEKYSLFEENCTSLETLFILWVLCYSVLDFILFVLWKLTLENLLDSPWFFSKLSSNFTKFLLESPWFWVSKCCGNPELDARDFHFSLFIIFPSYSFTAINPLNTTDHQLYDTLKTSSQILRMCNLSFILHVR